MAWLLLAVIAEKSLMPLISFSGCSYFRHASGPSLLVSWQP
jgi:hypothetical protein